MITLVVVVSAPLVRSLPLVPKLAVTTLVTVALMTWVVMPRVTRLLGGWLYPGGGDDPGCVSTGSATARAPSGSARGATMRIVILGASGSTGRLLTEQALAAGHDVVAVTRRPADFPIRHEQLSVMEADVHDGRAVDRAVEGADVVLSTLGVPFTRKPVNIYSDGIRNIIAAMSRHGVERVVVVTSSATEPHHHADGGFLLYRVLLQLVIATFGKTSISDMRRMEAVLRDSDLRWTIMRPSKLFDAPGVSSYELHEGQAPDIFTSRADLAASLLKQATDDRFVRKAVEVTTSQGVPTLLQLSRR